MLELKDPLGFGGSVPAGICAQLGDVDGGKKKSERGKINC